MLGISFVALAPMHAFASTNINASTTEHWAWNDAIGWIDFYDPSNLNVTVNSTGITGYASSSAGYVSLDCHTSPSSTNGGNICATSNYQVLNDGSGNLSGWAWNDAIGWISFCGGLGSSSSFPNCPGNVPYQVTISTAGGTAGDFYGYAWNDAVGWIDFNCANVPGNGSGSCNAPGGSQWKVNASWSANPAAGYLDSTTFDTGSVRGAQLNSVMWRGVLPPNTSVGFQFAVNNSSSGPWNFMGPDGTTSTFYGASPPIQPNTPIPLNYSLYSGYRYFRYRVTLTSNASQTSTPQVTGIIVNYSPY